MDFWSYLLCRLKHSRTTQFHVGKMTVVIFVAAVEFVRKNAIPAETEELRLLWRKPSTKRAAFQPYYPMHQILLMPFWCIIGFVVTPMRRVVITELRKVQFCNRSDCITHSVRTCQLVNLSTWLCVSPTFSCSRPQIICAAHNESPNEWKTN